MKVVNIFGGPGSGKSTTAAGIFYKMKLMGLNVELVTEFAKDLVYGGQIELLLDQQEYIFAEQNYRLHRLRDHVDFAIIDSPIILGCVYAQADYPIRDMFCEFSVATFNMYDNTNILLRRDHNYDPNGRRQDELEAAIVDDEIVNMLLKYRIPFSSRQIAPAIVDEIIEEIIQ